MRILKEDTKIDFLGKKQIAVVVSAVFIVMGIASIIFHGGLNYGIDFSGGYQVRIAFEKAADLNTLRGKFTDLGVSVNLQTIGEGNEIKLVLPDENPVGDSKTISNGLRNLLEAEYPNMEIRSVENVGPKVGQELRTSSLYAILLALGLILVYITFRFHWKFGISAILTLTHDVLIVVGFFSVFDREFSLTVVAALLTVVGYSLNDTIVIFDRIRENMGRHRKKKLDDVINLSINETLSRTMLTSGTTLCVVLVLFFLGGSIINDFAFGILIGVVVGTYSSMYVASPLLIVMSVSAPSPQQQVQKA